MSGALKTPKLLGSKSLAEAIKALRSRVEEAEENYRKEKQARQTLQGRLEDALKDLQASKQNTKRLENLVVKLNSKGREQEIALEEENKRKSEQELELKTVQSKAASITKKAQLVEERNEKVLNIIESLKRQLRAEKGINEDLATKLHEAEASVRAAQELQSHAEKRAAEAEGAKESVERKLSIANRKRNQMQNEVDTAKATAADAKFQAKALAAQYHAEKQKNAALEKEVKELRQELDSVSSLLLLN